MIRIIAEGDFHSADLLGLAHPDHWPARKRKLAALMWDWRAERVKEIGKVDIHLLGGDMCEGPGRKETFGLLTTDLDEQAEMSAEAVEVVKADYRYFSYGTPLHVAAFLKVENLVAGRFGEKPRETWRIGPLHGVRLMDRHVLGRSDIPYGQGTQLFKEWVRDQLAAAMEDYRAADLHIRHHVHYFFETRGSRGRAVACPCWKYPTPPDGRGSPYPWTLRTQYYDVGFLLIEIDKTGEVYVRPQIMPLKLAIPREYVCPKIADNNSPPRGK